MVGRDGAIVTCNRSTMRTRFNATAAAAMLLAATSAHYALFSARPASPVASRAQQTPAATPLGPLGRMALERCIEHVEIIHDVHWAAACMLDAKQEQARQAACLRARLTNTGDADPGACAPRAEPPDDSAECTLPPARAAVQEAGRMASLRRCRSEAAELERMAGRQPPAR
jgi:hypothetical protein